MVATQSALGLSLFLSTAVRALLERSQPPGEDPRLVIDKLSRRTSVLCIARVTFMLLAGLLLLPKAASAIRAGSGSGVGQTSAGSAL